jgi:hypothetical protein
MEEPMDESNQEMTTRIRARHIRERLLSRHGACTHVRRVLEQLTDAELLGMAAEHHAQQVAFAREQKANE